MDGSRSLLTVVGSVRLGSVRAPGPFLPASLILPEDARVVSDR